MPKPVNHHHRDEPVGGVPVKAPHDASKVPLNMGYPLDRGVGLGRAYAVEYEKIKARKENYPEKKNPYRAEAIKRVEFRDPRHLARVPRSFCLPKTLP